MVENLIDFLSAYKSSMEYKSLDSDADKILDLFVKYCQLKILMS
jgi:hypothetical protein